MVPQLVKGTPEVSPPPPNLEDIQLGNFKVYSRLNSTSSGQTAPSPSRIVQKPKCEAL